jgi:uncharacterized Zn finger protein (UPF0148 family)
MQDNKKTNDTSIKRMADLLSQGATLTDLSCPACSAPLFRLKDGTLWCGNDEKKVVIVKDGEEPAKTESNAAMATLETTLLSKVEDLQSKIQQTENMEDLQKFTAALSDLLSSLEKIKRLKKI